MWIRCCLILHNLILRIEAGGVDAAWREELYNIWDSAEGAERRRRQEEGLDDGSEDELEPGRAERQAMSGGQRFRCNVMNNLFDSPASGAVRRT